MRLVSGWHWLLRASQWNCVQVHRQALTSTDKLQSGHSEIAGRGMFRSASLISTRKRGRNPHSYLLSRAMHRRPTAWAEQDEAKLWMYSLAHGLAADREDEIRG